LSPSELIGKTIFQGDTSVIPVDFFNQFCTVTAVSQVISVQRSALIAGELKDVSTVMFYKCAWLEKFYVEPISRNPERLLRARTSTLHCSHCDGEQGQCVCCDCLRTDVGKCKSFMDTVNSALQDITHLVLK
jgi:hypothetical protein